MVPVHLSDDWNLINRVIFPVIYQPELVPGEDSEFGLGDVNYTAYFSPQDSGEVIWGVGPSIQLPTHTDDRLGSDLWGLGPSVVVLTMSNPWVLGAVVNNIWSLGSDSGDPSYNKMLLQPRGPTKRPHRVEPRHWTAIGRRLGRLADRRTLKRDGKQFRA